MNTMKSPIANSPNVKNNQLSVARPMALYRKSLRVLMLCALIAGALLSFFPLSAGTQTAADRIRLNRDIRKCWHKQEPGMDNGNIIHLWDCDAGPVENRAFYYDPATGFIRSSITPSKCIHKQNNGFETGDILHLWDCKDGAAENKTFNYNDQDGRVQFRSNTSFCAMTKNIGGDNGNPIVVGMCKNAESYSIAVPKSSPPPNQGGVPCSNVRLASETLVLEVKTGDLNGAGSSATMMIRIVFDDWDTGLFKLNSDRYFYAGRMEVIDTGIQIPVTPSGCNRKGTGIKSLVIENKGSSGPFSADAWYLESICARSSLHRICGNPQTINKWISGGGRLAMGR